MLPKSLVKLRHLRYLNLSYGQFKVLPSGFTCLQNLQTLKLLNCELLEELPRNIRKLINLRHLEIDGRNRLTYMPSRFGELTKLQTLPLFVIGNGESKGTGGLCELKCLNNLRGELWIKILGGVKALKGGTLESKEAILKEKHYLQSLVLEWKERREASSSDEDGELVMEGLQPHPNLKKLYIEGYPGVRFPSWMSSVLPSLQRLDLRNLNALEYMLENSSSAEPFFPSLKTLNLDGLHNFKGWCRREIAGEQAPSFPSLSQSLIRYCHQLTTFQLLSSPSLSKLVIRYCSSLKSLQLPSCPSLSELEIDGCDQLTTFQLLSSPCLSKLVIWTCNSLESLQLPSCPSLSGLEINRCRQLTTVQLFSSPRLFKLDIWNCSSLLSLQLPFCPSLFELEISGCGQLTTFHLPSFPRLFKLVIRNFSSLESLQLPSFPSLSQLMINGCDELTTFELLPCPRLSQLEIWNCWCLESLQLPPLPCLEALYLCRVCEKIVWHAILVSCSLKSLHIRGINDLVSLPVDRLQHLTSLKSLEIGACDGLMSLFQGIQHLSTLEVLRIINCRQLNMSDKEDDDGGLQFQGLRSLRQLFIQLIPQLVSLPKGLQHVTTLETLTIRNCSDFTTLPDWIGSLTSLSKLQIWICPRFKLEDRSKIAHIQEIDIP